MEQERPRKAYLEQLLRLGNFFELNFRFDPAQVTRELEPFRDQWKQYNPYKPQNPRQGLSLTSLDGSMTGEPDLYSLREYYKREGKLYRERDFRTLTPVFEACPSVQPLIRHFHPHLGRTHFLRFGAGGYFPPHRDGAAVDEAETFRVIVPLSGVCRNNFVFLYGEERLILEIGQTYFLNTLVNHSLFAFAPVTLLICNVILNEETLARTKAVLNQV